MIIGKRKTTKTTRQEIQPYRPLSQKARILKTVQQSIPYIYVYNNGVIQTAPDTYTKAYRLSDINFRIVPTEDQKLIYRKYGEFLNSFTSNVKFQILIQNRNADKREMMDRIRFQPKRDGLNLYRQEMNMRVLYEKLMGGQKNIEQQKYIVVSVSDDDVESAMKRLENLDTSINDALTRISKTLAVEAETSEERLRTLFEIYNQDGEAVFNNDFDGEGNPYFNMDAVYKAGLTTKDVIAPSGMTFRPGYFQIGNTFGRSMAIDAYATWVSTEFLSELTSSSYNMLVSIHYEPIETEKAMRMMRDNMLGVNANIAAAQHRNSNEGLSADLISPDLQLAQQQIRDLMDDMVSRDQKLFWVRFTITVFADSLRELDASTEALKSLCTTKLNSLITLMFQQEDGLNSTLPLCVNKINTKRQLTTESASIFLPFTSLEINEKEGVYYGVNEITKNIITYSRKYAVNHNGLIFGSSGGGKSFAAKCEMLSVLLRDEDSQIFILDPEEEYSDFVRAMNGELIDLSPSSKSYINPLDMDLDYDGKSDPVSMKSEYIISLFEIILGPGQMLNPQATGIISRCVSNIYRPYLEHLQDLRNAGEDVTCDKQSMPTLSNLYHELRRQPEPEAATLANIIELYAVGQASIFAHRSNVETDSRLVSYNICNLGAGMKTLGLYVCLNDVWNKMIENRKKNKYTWFYIDEFYLLLSVDSAAKFLSTIWKRARKWNGVPTGIMQNTEDLLRSIDGRNIFGNTKFIQMLSMSTIDRNNIGDQLKLPESMLEYVNGSKKGHGLIYNGATTIPFDNDFPKDTTLYALMDTSDASDKRKQLIRERLERKGKKQK